MEKILKKIVLTNWSMAIAGLVVEVGLLILNHTLLPPQVPLLYSRPWGDDQLISGLWLWVIPVVQLIIGICGELVSKTKRDDLLLKTMIVSTFTIVQLMLILGFVRTISLIT
ncbi:MAG: hypothetical protein UU93_C0001G0039 [Candidatus Amesbacteria bacterium GW2011_GWA2_42_12]|uniref:DUF1648 domain-containing protein n=1 Tax=Candidatus Amesbacteria bacterium GW2011_GWA2_42_12 TaxID=1618356 RepID=A0A0G1B6U2_9BACT|nr:MAG: hypothetical protein UU93_C0001G0039 [Candidatus Amesbacteria bacterium GW2011_GWA2_42_12]